MEGTLASTGWATRCGGGGGGGDGGAAGAAAVPLSCISWAMMSTIAAMARGPLGLPSIPAQNEDHFAPVNHFCALSRATRLSPLRRQSRGCFHSESCSLICPRASSEALERMECFQGILGKFELSQMQCIQQNLPEVVP